MEKKTQTSEFVNRIVSLRYLAMQTGNILRTGSILKSPMQPTSGKANTTKKCGIGLQIDQISITSPKWKPICISLSFSLVPTTPMNQLFLIAMTWFLLLLPQRLQRSPFSWASQMLNQVLTETSKETAQPQHQVTLSPFYIDKTEVTVNAYVDMLNQLHVSTTNISSLVHPPCP